MIAFSLFDSLLLAVNMSDAVVSPATQYYTCKFFLHAGCTIVLVGCVCVCVCQWARPLLLVGSEFRREFRSKKKRNEQGKLIIILECLKLYTGSYDS